MIGEFFFKKNYYKHIINRKTKSKNKKNIKNNNYGTKNE